MKLLVIIISFVLTFTAVSAWSDCEEPLVPALPNPDLAGENEMRRAQLAVKHYLSEQQAFLACVGNDRRHNEAVDRMHELAQKYNKMARRYNARMQSLDMYTELALLEI
jgi:hypothetical protein